MVWAHSLVTEHSRACEIIQALSMGCRVGHFPRQKSSLSLKYPPDLRQLCLETTKGETNPSSEGENTTDKSLLGTLMYFQYNPPNFFFFKKTGLKRTKREKRNLPQPRYKATSIRSLTCAWNSMYKNRVSNITRSSSHRYLFLKNETLQLGRNILGSVFLAVEIRFILTFHIFFKKKMTHTYT